MYFQHEISGAKAAELLGVSRRTVYRWIDEGRLTYPLTAESLRARPAKRQRGPKRNPQSRRYTQGRHRFRVEESQRISGGVEQGEAQEESVI